MTRNSIFITTLFCCITFLFSNTLLSQGNVHKLTGRVVDHAGHPIPAATILLVDSSSNKKQQTFSDSTGQFQLLHVSALPFRILVTHAGLKPFQSALIQPGSSDAGTIALAKAENELQDVTVQSTQKIIEVNAGTITYNVAQSINAQGTDALEVLKRAPGIYVDNQNAIFLNGKQGALILLDGKQTYLSGRELTDILRSLPSSAIRSIEIINSPTAKYDAAGSAGIINIKTIKSSLRGFTGNITTGITVGVWLKQNSDLSFSYRNNRYSLYGSYSHFFGHYNYLYGSDRVQLGKTYNSFTDDTDKRSRINSRFGMDYNLNKNSTIGMMLSGNLNFGGGFTATKTDIGTYNTPGIEQTLHADNDYYYQQTQRYNLNLNYKFENQSGTTLNIDADYGSFDKNNKNLQSNIYTDPQQAVTGKTVYRTFNGIDIDLKAIKLDYAKKLLGGLLETGAKYSNIHTDNSADFYHVISSGDSLDEQRTNTFAFREQITSTYINYKKTSGRFTWQAGLRLENTLSVGSLFFKKAGLDSTERIRRQYTNLFPSGNISYKLNDKHSFSLGYARRIDRPAYQDLNPFIYLLDELSFWQGNPFLRPQYTGKTTLQYVYKSATIISASYLHSNGYSANITDTLQGSKIVMIPRNVGTQEVYSLSLTQVISPKKWWEININGTLNRVQNKISFDQYRYMELKQTTARLTVQQRFKLPKSLTIEISGVINSRRLVGANEIIQGQHQTDLGLQKIILKSKGTLRLSIIDIYKGNQFKSTQNFQGFNFYTYAYYETRQLRLNFTYKFADAGGKAPRSRVSALENENGRIK